LSLSALGLARFCLRQRQRLEQLAINQITKVASNGQSKRMVANKNTEFYVPIQGSLGEVVGSYP